MTIVRISYLALGGTVGKRRLAAVGRVHSLPVVTVVKIGYLAFGWTVREI